MCKAAKTHWVFMSLAKNSESLLLLLAWPFFAELLQDTLVFFFFRGPSVLTVMIESGVWVARVSSVPNVNC